MSKSLTSLIVVAVVLVAAIALNPSADRHREKIKVAFGERSQLEKLLGVGHVAAFASKYHSFLVG